MKRHVRRQVVRRELEEDLEIPDVDLQEDRGIPCELRAAVRRSPEEE